MKSDIEIAQEAVLRPITQIAATAEDGKVVLRTL